MYKCVKCVAHDTKCHHLCNGLDPWDCCNLVQKVLNAEAFFCKVWIHFFFTGKNKSKLPLDCHSREMSVLEKRRRKRPE
jgi:hypothetical protein